MTLRIDSSTRICDIQDIFNDAFSHLHLEFFKTPHQLHEASPKKDMRAKEELALSSDRRHTVAEITFDSNWTVCELEETFLIQAGLHVQVFRKSGNVWIETSLTDDWTLDKQNKEGELFSTLYPPRSHNARHRE